MPACPCPLPKLGAMGQLLNPCPTASPGLGSSSTLHPSSARQRARGARKACGHPGQAGDGRTSLSQGTPLPRVCLDALCLGAAAQREFRQSKWCVPAYLYLSAFPWQCEPPSLPLCAHTHMRRRAAAAGTRRGSHAGAHARTPGQHTRACTHTRARARAHALTCPHACMHIHVRAHTRTHVHVYTRMLACTHTGAHTHTKLFSLSLSIRGQVPQASRLCLLLTSTKSRLLVVSALAAEH